MSPNEHFFDFFVFYLFIFTGSLREFVVTVPAEVRRSAAMVSNGLFFERLTCILMFSDFFHFYDIIGVSAMFAGTFSTQSLRYCFPVWLLCGFAFYPLCSLPFLTSSCFWGFCFSFGFGAFFKLLSDLLLFVTFLGAILVLGLRDLLAFIKLSCLCK